MSSAELQLVSAEEQALPQIQRESREIPTIAERQEAGDASDHNPTDEKEIQEEDEKGVSEVVRSAILAPENPEEFKRFMARQEAKFGKHFSNPEQMEAFAMLPLKDSEKENLVERLVLDRQAEAARNKLKVKARDGDVLTHKRVR